MPMWIVITHFINLVVILLLIRSGLHILADHPMLYWTDHTERDNYWLKFGRKKIPKDKVYQAHDEAEPIGHWALPGGEHHDFGNARNWHLTAAMIWLATGAVYWGYMFVTGAWRRLIPTSWSVFPDAWHDMLTYLSFHRPPIEAFQPYDPLQQITYAAVAFLLPVVMLLTAMAMSPALMNRFPKYLLLFGGRRQVARSIHFLGMVAFSVFIIMHVLMVALVYFYRNVQIITFGHTGVNFSAALTVFMAGLLFVLVFHVVITYFTVNHRVQTRRVLVSIINPVVHIIFGRMKPKNTYKRKDISPDFRVNGLPPDTEEFYKLRDDGFKNYKLKIGGLVEKEIELSLAEIKKMPKREQITKHICIQGWSAIGEWGGVRMSDIMKLVRPAPSAKYIILHAFDIDANGKPYYEVLKISDMYDKYSILAWEMNWKDLPQDHGAPLRLRCERHLGYKMVKYIKSIEFVDSYKDIYGGRGGYREDNVLFDNEALI